MATFQPDDLKDQALRRLATELDVAEAGRSRPDVEQEILQKYPNALLMSAILHSTPTQARSGNRDWGAWLAIGFAALTAITTAYIAYANSDSANTARESLNAEIVKTRESRQREEATTSENQRRLWQLVIVFKIIDEGTKANWHGITLNEIRTRYTTEAASSPHNLTIDDKNELAIRRLILSLMEHRLVYTTTANKYITAQTIITPKEDICCGKSVEKIRYFIINLLVKNSDAGKHTVLELANMSMQNIPESTSEETNCVITTLAAQNVLIVDFDRKIWSAANPPRISKKLPKDD